MKSKLANITTRNMAIWLAIALPCLFLFGCTSDDDLVPPNENSHIILSEDAMSLSYRAQYRTIHVECDKECDPIQFSVDCDWIKFDADTIPSDGILEFLVDRDDEGIQRSADIVFTTSHPDGSTSRATCTVTQGLDSGTNSDIPENVSMYVGCGYDIYGHFNDGKSAKEPILSNYYLGTDADEHGLIETSPFNNLRVENIYARSLDEMASLLTEQEEKNSSGIRGAAKTTKIHTKGKYKSTESQFVHLSLLKTVAMRSLDVGVFEYLRNNPADKPELFSDNFRRVYDAIIADPSDKNINSMLDNFGTHIIVYAELGASIELAVNFSMTMQGSLSMRSQDLSDYFFRNKSSDFLLSNGTIADLTTTITSDANCLINGGSSSTKKAISDEINKKGRPSPETLNNWLASSDDAHSGNVIPIRFQMIPIWNLFPAEYLSDIVRLVNARATQSNNQYSDVERGTDYYKITLTPEMLSFDSGADATLVKVVYARGTSSGQYAPILEICNEYVPHIRGDKRINVIYGIRNGAPFLGSGFFPGDGEGNPPAWLTFSDGQVYVLPVDSCQRNEIKHDLYYLHGNIYDKDYNTKPAVPQSMKVEAQYLQLDQKYPIVKIGSGYWSRKNLREEMGFGEPVDPDDEYSDYYIYEELKDGILYANIFYGRNPDYKHDTFGPDIRSDYNARTKWFLPREADIINLKTYVDNNPRALLKGQVSGFNAEFVGAYAVFDDFTQKPLGHYQKIHTDCCFIPCKEYDLSDNGSALIIDSNYRLSSSNLFRSNENFYPVRPYRTAYWKYNNQ